MSPQKSPLLEFDSFLLNPEERLLLRNGEPISLPPKTFDLLLVLVENRGHLLQKEELMKSVWPDSFVEEANLSHHVFMLRKALSDGENGETYIETVPKRGYRFVSDVKESRGDGLDSSAGMNPPSHSSGAQDTARSTQFEPVQKGRSTPPGTDSSKETSGPAKKKGLVTLLLMVAVITGILLFRSAWDPPKQRGLEQVRSIAVLPFKSIGLEDAEEGLGLVMADAVITQLGSLDRVIVRPTTAIFKYQGRDHDPLAVGRELRVDAVLAGNTQRAGDRMRLTVQLMRTGDGRLCGRENSMRRRTDLFALEDSLAEAVARSLLPKLTSGEERQLTRRYTADIVAYNSYLKGRYFLEIGELKKARECFESCNSARP